MISRKRIQQTLNKYKRRLRIQASSFDIFIDKDGTKRPVQNISKAVDYFFRNRFWPKYKNHGKLCSCEMCSPDKYKRHEKYKKKFDS